MDSSADQNVELVSRLQRHIEAGEQDEARAILSAAEVKEVCDADLHSSLAIIAEQLGDLRRAILEYNLSLRDAPGQARVLRRLGRLRADRGEYRRALKAFRRLLDFSPDDDRTRIELGGVMTEMGRPEEAAALFAERLEQGDAPEVKLALERLKRGSDAPSPRPAASSFSPESPGEIVPTDADLVAFSSIFAGREGVHARQWASPTGKCGYTPIHEPFTPAVARGHLLGNYTVGIYPLRMDNSVLFLAFDLDVAKFAMARQAAKQRSMEGLLRRTQEIACRLLDAAASHEITGYIEDSGHKGRHVWIFFNTPLPATAARRLAHALSEAAGPLPPEVTLEIFPKQARVTKAGLGNLIKLPLGVHRATGRRGLFVDPRGCPHGDQLEFLRGIGRVSREVIKETVRRAALSSREHAGASRPDASPRDAGNTSPATSMMEGPSSEEVQELSLVPEEPLYNPDEDLELLWLLERCPLLAELVRRAQSTNILSHEERLVLTYTAGHLSRGPEAVNALLANTLNADSRAFLKSRLRGNPMSCPKMRSRVPDLAAAVSCDCRFEEGAGLYPTPLLHLQSLRGRGTLEGDPTRFSTLQVERLISDLYRARIKAERASRLARDIEERLMAFMEEQGTHQLNTAAGTLRIEAGPRPGLALLMPGATPRESNEGGKSDGRRLRDRAGSDGGDPPRPARDPQGGEAH